MLCGRLWLRLISTTGTLVWNSVWFTPACADDVFSTVGHINYERNITFLSLTTIPRADRSNNCSRIDCVATLARNVLCPLRTHFRALVGAVGLALVRLAAVARAQSSPNTQKCRSARLYCRCTDGALHSCGICINRLVTCGICAMNDRFWEARMSLMGYILPHASVCFLAAQFQTSWRRNSNIESGNLTVYVRSSLS